MKQKAAVKISTGRPGRPREFDIDVATRDAMEVFWQNGFHATSLPDLIEGMGLTRGSIYKAYDDKRSIYLAALDVYIENKLAEFERALGKPDRRAAMREVFRILGRDSASDQGRKGCFSTAALIEMVPNDDEVEERLAEMYARIETMMVRVIDAGKKDGSFATSTPTRDVAKLLLCVMNGVTVAGKFGPTERANQKLATIALSLLD